MNFGAASRWFAKFNPLRAETLDRKRIADGLMMYRTNDPDKPVTFRFYTDDGKAQYSLTRSETIYLTSQLDDFLKKGPLP